MKTIKVTYTEVYHVQEVRIVEVSNEMYKHLQNEDSEHYQNLLNEMDGVTCVLDSPTERDITDMCIELATQEDEERYFELDF